MYNFENMDGLSQDFTHYCLNLFYALGVRTIFTIPGAHIEHFILAVSKDNRFKLVVSAHEEGAGFMADGYFRKSKQTSVVATINGPGVTNLITAASTAKMDHSSVIFLTGDTPLSIKDKLGFQSSIQDGCKSSELMKLLIDKQIIPTDSNQLFYSIQDFYASFKQGDYYPMHINIHNDVFKQSIIKNHVLNDFLISRTLNINLEAFNFKIDKSVVILGEDLNNLDDINILIEFCTQYSIPIVCTSGAKNTQALIPVGLYCGVYGYAGNSSAIQLISDDNIETIYFFGTELNERNTMAWSHKLFRRNRTIFSINNNLQMDGIVEYPVQYIQCSIMCFIDACKKNNYSYEENDTRWFNSYVYQPKTIEIVDKSIKLNMVNCLMVMNKEIHNASNLFLDSGDHRIYGSQFWDVKEYNTFFTAAKNAPMGWAIGAGIGASFVDNTIATWILTGDGCMLMHGNEIAVASRYHRNIKLIVINNGSYGRIELRLNKEEELTRNQISRLPNVSWTQYAHSLGVQAVCVYTVEELQNAIVMAQESTEPYLIEVMIKIDNEVPISESVFSSTSSSFKLSWKVE